MRAISRLGAVCLPALLATSVLLATPASADVRCTDQINYAGDPRPNAEINSIGASTGKCPAPMTSGRAALPPGCDWNTDIGTQACLGGGPFDAGKNGNGDTYGPSGEVGFLQDNRMSFPRLADQDLLRLGYVICDGVAKGLSDDQMQSVLKGKGVDEVSAGAVVTSAQMFLCSY